MIPTHCPVMLGLWLLCFRMGNILLILLMENLMLRQRLGIGMILGLRVMMICRPTTFHTEIHQTVVYPGGQPIATASPQEQPQPQQQEQGPPQNDGPFSSKPVGSQLTV